MCQPYGTEKVSARELSVINAYIKMIRLKKMTFSAYDLEKSKLNTKQNNGYGRLSPLPN